jgi:predicted AAA+ superfamily ATPase
LFDWVEVEQESIRFENLIALHLLKAVGLWKAMGESNPQIHYLRDKEKREIDFVISERGKPVCLIECKLAEEDLSPTLLYYQKKLSIPFAIQLLHKSGICKKMRVAGLIQWIISADQWLTVLP